MVGFRRCELEKDGREKVTLKPPEGKESVINISTRLLGDLA